MAATVNTERVIETTVGGGPRPGSGFRKNGGGRFGRDGEPLQFSPSRYRIGAWAGIGGIVMLFTALASAYIVRSASGNDWQPIVMPKVLWLSTAVILISSATRLKGNCGALARRTRRRFTGISWMGFGSVCFFCCSFGNSHSVAESDQDPLPLGEGTGEGLGVTRAKPSPNPLPKGEGETS